MAKDDQDVGTSVEPYYEGDSLELVISVDEDGSDKDLTGASVEWAMSRDPSSAEEISESTTGVSASVTDAATGEITVTIAQGITDGKTGRWHHETRVTDSSGDKAVVTRGEFYIIPRVNA